jgi:hypothetical protein
VSDTLERMIGYEIVTRFAADSNETGLFERAPLFARHRDPKVRLEPR